MGNMANAGIVISGIMDGTTISYSVQAVDATGANVPLVQHYNESIIDPDWGAMAKGSDADKKLLPRIVIKATDTATQQVLDGQVRIVSVQYNGFTVEFGDDGVSDNVMPGVLKKETVTFGGITHDCIKFVGNPAAGDPGTHTDQLELTGYVTTESGPVKFKGLLIPIEIFEVTSADEGFSADIWTPEGDQNIQAANGNTKRRVTFYKGVKEVTDGSNYTVKWFDITGDTDVLLVNGQGGIIISTSDAAKPAGDTITIPADAVNSSMTFAARIYKTSDLAQDGTIPAGVLPIAADTDIAYDFSDPFQIRWVIRDSVSGSGVEVECERGQYPRFDLRRGWTRYFFPIAYNTSGDVADNKVAWAFNFDDAKDGADITGIATGSNYFPISYSDVVTSQGRRSIIAHAQATITL